MKITEDMTLYEVLTPEKIAALLAQQGKTQHKDAPQELQADAAPIPSAPVKDAPAQEVLSENSTAEFIEVTLDDAPQTAPAQPSAPTPAGDAFFDEAQEEAPRTVRVIDVCFREGGKSYYFDPGTADVHDGDGVIVETARGVEYGDVLHGGHEILCAQLAGELKPIIRIATQQDAEQRAKNRVREKDAYGICQKKILDHALDMKLVDVEYAFTGAKITFYFTADGRVDFRELVKDLAGIFKTRIELRQIGVRDEAKLLGGLGSCGRPVCCKQFLPDFQPVSIKMAKEQSLSLSPTKISGICGRLMCCLQYEQATYEAMRKRMPRVGKEVMSPDGQGTVLENNIITEKTRIKMVLADGTIDVRWFPFEELTLTDAPRLEPAPRPPKVERLSRRERMLRDQQARKDAELAAAAPEPVLAQSESADAEDAAKRKRPRRRRHKSGKGEGGAENAPSNENA